MRKSLLPLSVSFAIWLVLPLAISTEGTLHLFVLSAINLILAVGLSLLFGYAGQISLGQAAFYGFGAYLSSSSRVNGRESSVN